MIPEEKSAAVTRGLSEAFGVTGFEDISRLTGGHTSSLVFRIVVKGSPFVLKLTMRTDDPTRHYTNMKAAAEAGLAPRVWYTNIEDRVAITDFVEAVPLPATDALTRIPAALRNLHALPPFAGVPHHINTTCMFLMHKGPALDGYLQKFRASSLPENVREGLLARFAQLAAVYPHHDPQMVSSHNDLFKPDNMLFDGHRLWLVDWEAAFLNDRYAELAVVANMLVTTEAEERTYLQEYFGQPPDRYQLARFFFMQQVAHVFYAMAFLWLGSSVSPLNLPEEAPTYEDFHRRYWAREIDLADHRMKTLYGRVHWERLLHNMRQPRFDEAIRIVSDRSAGSGQTA
jgi:hypothetical protein